MILISRMAGKLVFLVGFAGGAQFPEFMNHYIQRLGGHLDEARKQLARFQQLADDRFGGDLQSLISAYQANASAAVQHTGEIVHDLNERMIYLWQSLEKLTQSEFFGQATYMLTQADTEIVAGTLRSFVPGVPLTLDALFCGVFAGFLGAGMWVAVRQIGKKWFTGANHQQHIS